MICFEFATVDPIPFIQVAPKIQWCDFTWTSSKSHFLQSSGPLPSALHEHEAGSTPSDTRIFRVKQPFNFLTFGAFQLFNLWGNSCFKASIPHTIHHHPRVALAIQASASLILQTSESDEESALLSCFPRSIQNKRWTQRREKFDFTVDATKAWKKQPDHWGHASAWEAAWHRHFGYRETSVSCDPSGCGGSAAQASLSETLTWSIKETAVGGRYGEQAVSLATFWRLTSFVLHLYIVTW